MRLILLHVITPIIVGGILYILYAPAQLVFFKWFEIFGLDNRLLFVRETGSISSMFMPRWLINFIPDILWAYSLTAALIIHHHRDSNFKILIFLPLFLGITIEIFQFNKIIAGTGDFFDVFAYLTGVILSLYLIKPSK